MDSLRDLLTQKNLDEPSELTALRKYLVSKFGFSPKITMSQHTITVVVSNGKIATEIRARTLEITRRCALTKKLFVKISGEK